MPVDVGRIAESSVQARFNPYDQPNPELHRIQGQLQGSLTRARTWEQASQIIGSVGNALQAQAQNKLATNSLKVSEADNSKAAVDTRKAIQAARNTGVDNVPADNLAVKQLLEQQVQEAIDVKIGIPRADKTSRREARRGVKDARKELRQFKQGVYDIETFSGGTFKTKEEASVFLEGYNKFKTNGPQDLKKLLVEMNDGKYDPFFNSKEEVVKYSLDQGRNGKFVVENGATFVEFTGDVPVRDKFGRVQYENGKLKLETKTAKYNIDSFNGQGSFYNQIQPPVSGGTIISRFKDEAPSAYRQWSDPNSPKIEAGGQGYDQLINTFQEQLDTNPDFIKSVQRSINLEAGEDVNIDLDNNGRVSAQELFTALEPQINVGKRSQAQIDFQRGVSAGTAQLGKESVLGKETKLTATERKALEELNVSKQKVVDLFNGNASSLIGEKFNGKTITGAVFNTTKEVTETRNRRVPLFGFPIPFTEKEETTTVPDTGATLNLRYETGRSLGKVVEKDIQIDLSDPKTLENTLRRVFGDQANELLKYIEENKFSFGNEDPLGLN